MMTDALDGAVVLSSLNEFMVTEHYINHKCGDQSVPGNCTSLVFGVAGLIQTVPPATALEFILNVDHPSIHP
eukprot:SAG11_NODE_22908_length_398_cov_0.866221_1_plen_71_part_10